MPGRVPFTISLSSDRSIAVQSSSRIERGRGRPETPHFCRDSGGIAIEYERVRKCPWRVRLLNQVDMAIVGAVGDDRKRERIGPER